MPYYHTTLSTPQISTTMIPQGYYERVKYNGDCPQPLFDDIGAGFPISDVPEVSFSLSLEGAILGGGKNSCPLETDCVLDVYTTEAEPDIDISDCGYDFSVLEEVRYRRTIPVQKKGVLTLEKKLTEQINSCYGLEDDVSGESFLDITSLECIKQDIKKQLKKSSVVLKSVDKNQLEECWAKLNGMTVEELREYERNFGK